MNKPEFYPYVLLPEEIEKIKIEGIPVPEIQELPPFPVKPKKKFLGTIILILSIAVIILASLKVISIGYSYNNMIIAFAFFVAIISLTATVFEVLQNGKLKKQFKIAIKLYDELKLEQAQVKEKRSKAIDDNNNPSAIESYRHDAISKYFRYSYNKIQAVQREHSPAQNRFMIFLEQYFEGKILENIRIYHEPKELDYSPNFVIKLDNPKVNIAIDIEEPYLFDGTKVVIKKNRAEESFKKRFRVTNELRWVSITFSEEQIVTNPMQACKLIAHTIDEILLKEKYSLLFKSIEKIKRVEIPGQRELSAFIRNKYREKYLTEAGLVDGMYFGLSQTDELGKEQKSLEEKEKVTEEKKEKIIKLPSITKEEIIPEKKKIIDLKTEETFEPKKETETKEVHKEIDNKESEVEQLQIVKKVTEKLRTEKLEKEEKEKIESEKLTEKEEKVEKQEKIVKPVDEKTKLSDKKITTISKKGQLRKEAEILNKLYANPEDQNEVKEEPEKTEKDKVEQEFIEKERLAKEKQETERLEKVKLEKERLEKEKAAKELLEKEKLVQEREDKKRSEQEKLEEEKAKKEQVEKELTEQKRLEEERIAKEKVENEKLALERIEKDLAEKKRLQEEQLAKEKAAQEKREQERLEEERQEKEAQLAKEKAEKEQLEKMIAEKKRLEEEQLEKIRQEKEKLELDKLQKELDKKAEIEANNKLMEQHKVQIETLVNNQEWEKLFDKCNQVISELPYWAWPYYRRSTVHGNQGKFDEVLEDCNKALALNPKLSDAYYNRATAKFFMEKYQDAADDYQKCIDLKYENSANAYFNKGLCFQNMNYQKKAYREFLKAKDLGSSKAVDVINKQYNNAE